MQNTSQITIFGAVLNPVMRVSAILCESDVVHFKLHGCSRDETDRFKDNLARESGQVLADAQTFMPILSGTFGTSHVCQEELALAHVRILLCTLRGVVLHGVLPPSDFYNEWCYVPHGNAPIWFYKGADTTPVQCSFVHKALQLFQNILWRSTCYEPVPNVCGVQLLNRPIVPISTLKYDLLDIDFVIRMTLSCTTINYVEHVRPLRASTHHRARALSCISHQPTPRRLCAVLHLTPTNTDALSRSLALSCSCAHTFSALWLSHILRCGFSCQLLGFCLGRVFLYKNCASPFTPPHACTHALRVHMRFMPQDEHMAISAATTAINGALKWLTENQGTSYTHARTHVHTHAHTHRHARTQTARCVSSDVVY